MLVVAVVVPLVAIATGGAAMAFMGSHGSGIGVGVIADVSPVPVGHAVPAPTATHNATTPKPTSSTVGPAVATAQVTSATSQPVATPPIADPSGAPTPAYAPSGSPAVVVSGTAISTEATTS
jgi:hypothetical protein